MCIFPSATQFCKIHLLFNKMFKILKDTCWLYVGHTLYTYMQIIWQIHAVWNLKTMLLFKAGPCHREIIIWFILLSSPVLIGWMIPTGGNRNRLKNYNEKHWPQACLRTQHFDLHLLTWFFQESWLTCEICSFELVNYDHLEIWQGQTTNSNWNNKWLFFCIHLCTAIQRR